MWNRVTGDRGAQDLQDYGLLQKTHVHLFSQQVYRCHCMWIYLLLRSVRVALAFATRTCWKYDIHIHAMGADTWVIRKHQQFSWSSAMQVSSMCQWYHAERPSLSLAHLTHDWLTWTLRPRKAWSAAWYPAFLVRCYGRACARDWHTLDRRD